MSSFQLPLMSQAMDVHPHAVWTLSTSADRPCSTPLAHCAWKAVKVRRQAQQCRCWIAGFVRRTHVVDYIELSNPLAEQTVMGARSTWCSVAEISCLAAAVLTRHSADRHAQWPLSFSLSLPDLLDGTSVSAALHCASPTSLCVLVLAHVNAPAALLRFVDHLSTLVNATLPPTAALLFADVVKCIRPDAVLARSLTRYTDSAPLKLNTAAIARLPFLDAPLVDQGGILTCLAPADLVRLLALLAVFTDDARSFVARVVIHGRDLRQIGLVASQLVLLTRSTLRFAGVVGMLADVGDLRAAFEVQWPGWPGIYTVETKLFAAARAELDDVAAGNAAELIVLDVDQCSLTVPPNFESLALLPEADSLIAQITDAMRGAVGAVAIDSLQKTRTIQLLVKQHIVHVLEDVMHVSNYLDLSSGIFAAQALCAAQTAGFFDRQWLTAPFRGALAHSPLLRDQYIVREIVVPHLAKLIATGDAATFGVLWRNLRTQELAKMVIYTTRLGADRCTLLHLACEHFHAGTATELATSGCFLDALINDAPDASVMEELDAQCHAPLYHLCRARPPQLPDFADVLRAQLLSPAATVEHPAQLLARPTYVLFRAWGNGTMLMSAVKNATADITLVLLDALGRVPAEFALGLVAARTYAGDVSVLHIACAGDGNAAAVAAILRATREWCASLRMDADDQVLALLSAPRDDDGRTPLHLACRLKSGDVLHEMLEQLSVAVASSARKVRALLRICSLPVHGSKQATALDDAVECQNGALEEFQCFVGALDVN
jgi:hypothetical protein